MGRCRALLARLEVEVVAERSALDDGRVLVRHKKMHVVCISDSDSQPALGGQDLAVGEGGEVVNKVADGLQRDPPISILRHWSRGLDYNRSVFRKTGHLHHATTLRAHLAADLCLSRYFLYLAGGVGDGDTKTAVAQS